MVRTFIIATLRAAAILAVAKGFLLWFASRGIYPDRWVASMIGVAEAAAGQTPSWVGWVLLGVIGLIGTSIWEVAKHKGWFPWQSKTLGRPEAAAPAIGFRKADLDEWRDTDPLTIWQAGNLWGGISPVFPVTFDNPAYPKFSMILRAVEQGDLKLAKESPQPDQAFAQVSRADLAEYAAQKGRVPEFLNDITPDELEDRGHNFISLNEAATRAYEATEGTLVAGVAKKALSGDEKRLLSWYANAIVGSDQRTPIFGKTPPSRVRRQISADEFTRCSFSGDAKSLSRFGEDEPKFVDLEISLSDFQKRLEEIKSWNGE